MGNVNVLTQIRGFGKVLLEGGIACMNVKSGAGTLYIRLCFHTFLHTASNLSRGRPVKLFYLYLLKLALANEGGRTWSFQIGI